MALVSRALTSREAAQAVRLSLGVLKRAALRCWGRDVMLYVGGVSFFALLAVVPALAILIGLYSAIFTPAQAAAQTEVFAQILPDSARQLILQELGRLSRMPAQTISAQSALALVIGGYAAHRGFKALLAGLNFIHDEEEPLGFLRFNLLAFFVALAAFGMATLISGLIIALRLLKTATRLQTGHVFGIFTNEWVWAAIGLTIGLTCLYRFAMSHSGPVIWRAAILGGLAAMAVSLAASIGSAFYVDQVVHLGATYGSIATVMVFLIWVSWTVNAVFFGGALATEVEISLNEYRARRRVAAPAVTLPATDPAFRS
jgi:membrane protein